MKVNNLGVVKNHPLSGMAMVSPSLGSSQKSGKPLSHSENSSLSEEEKAKAEKMKQAHIQSLHRSFLSSQSETPGNSST
jgi:hypothetical protein